MFLADAVKFCDGSDVTVSVQCEAAADDADADRRVLTLEVADGGRGMAPDECARIFDAYYRAPTHRGGGTGLGALRVLVCAACWCSQLLTDGFLVQGCTSARDSWKVRCSSTAWAVCHERCLI